MEYTVHIAVVAHLGVKVDAADPDDAQGKAQDAFWAIDEMNLSDLKIVDARPTCCEDGTGAIVKEY